MKLNCMLILLVGLCLFSFNLTLKAEFLPIDFAPWVNMGYEGDNMCRWNHLRRLVGC